MNIKPHWLSDSEAIQLGEEQSGRRQNNPVRKYKGAWYYFDETWSSVFGPFETEEEATKAVKEYCEHLGLLP